MIYIYIIFIDLLLQKDCFTISEGFTTVIFRKPWALQVISSKKLPFQLADIDRVRSQKSAAKAWQCGCGGRRTEETYTHSFSDSLYLRLSKWTRFERPNGEQVTAGAPQIVGEDIVLGPNGTEVLVKQATTLSSQERSIVKQMSGCCFR